jgi:indolepyruvate decarboxylase
LSIRYHTYEEVRFKDFLCGLLKLPLRRRTARNFPRPTPLARLNGEAANEVNSARSKRRAPGSSGIKVKRLFERLNRFLSTNTIVVADVGDALFGATDLFIRERTEFIAPAYYTSMGFAVPACIGAQLANPKLRPLVLVGDGAFQMTGMELATVARYRLNPVVVVLNNFGYGTERHMQDGPYNDVWPWEYHRLPEVLGAGHGFLVRTESELDAALSEAQRRTDAFCLLDVRLAQLDRSPALDRLASRLARRI